MKISIVIPTRERGAYLKHSLRSALAIEDVDVEIIVTDNESTDGTEAIVAQFGDPRLRYVGTGARVSMRQNFENGLRHTTGDYVIFFGDDDGILPGQFPFLRRILETETPDTLSWGLPTYGWPVPGFGGKTGSIRFERGRTYGLAQSVDATLLRNHLLACRIGMVTPRPAIYHGCVSRDYLERLRGKNGEVFNSSIPDVHLMYRTLFEGGKLIHVDHMFTLNGFSPASTGNAHHAYASGDARAEPARRFKVEMGTDPVQDVIENAPSVALVQLATLETIRETFPETAQPAPDYDAWYRYVLVSARRSDTELRETLERVLSAHALRTGTMVQYKSALATERPTEGRLARLGAQIARLREKRGSFRLPAAIGDENTILTAVLTCDRLLGQDYAAVLDGTMNRSAAWANLRQRARK